MAIDNTGLRGKEWTPEKVKFGMKVESYPEAGTKSMVMMETAFHCS